MNNIDFLFIVAECELQNICNNVNLCFFPTFASGEVACISGSHVFFFFFFQFCGAGLLNIEHGVCLFLAKVLTGIVILKHVHVSKEGKLTPWLKSSTTFLLPRAVNATMQTSIRLMLLALLHKQAHGVSSTPPTRPFMYLLTKFGTCTTTRPKTHLLHALIRATRTWPFTLYELGRETRGRACRKKSGQFRAGHTLCTSKNVRWFVGSSPSHLHFLQRTFDCD